MFIPGEAGVWKSKTLQTITANFLSQGVGAILVERAYTEITVSAIDGKTLHSIAIVRNDLQTIKAFELYWYN